MTGAAGAVGANVAVLARERGWQVTGLARAGDDEFVRGLGADFTAHAEQGLDAVVDPAQLADLLTRAAAGELPTRVHAVVPLDRAAEAHRATADSGLRGRYVIRPVG